MADEQNRIFGIGEKLKIAKKSRVVDTERAGEGLPPDERIPIDQDVTGQEGEVIGIPYYSEPKGEHCVPLRLPNEAVISVPESRLERTARTPRLEAGIDNPALDDADGSGGGSERSNVGSVSKETIEFWRDYFKKRGLEETKEGA